MAPISSSWIQALYSNRAPLFISCEWYKVFSFVLLWWTHSTYLMLKCLVWVFYIIPIDYLSHSYSELDMSTARRRLKSPQSLYGTSTHPTIVTHRSQSWSWMINSQPFLSMSVRASSDTAILKFDLEKSKVKVMGEVKGQGHIVHSVSNRCTSLSFPINPTNHSWDMSNKVFDLEKKHIRKIGFETEFLQNLTRWWPWPEGYNNEVL